MIGIQYSFGFLHHVIYHVNKLRVAFKKFVFHNILIQKKLFTKAMKCCSTQNHYLLWNNQFAVNCKIVYCKFYISSCSRYITINNVIYLLMKVLCPFIKETSNFCFAKVLELKSAEAPKRKTEYYLDQKD